MSCKVELISTNKSCLVSTGEFGYSHIFDLNILLIHPFVIARNTLLTSLRRVIQVGHLTIYDQTNTYTFGSYSKDAVVAELRVINADFWTRVFM